MVLYDVGRCLIQVRLKERGMTQLDLSLKIKMSESQISDYANNRKTMSLKNAINISNGIGCKVTQLYELIPIVSNGQASK